MKTNDIHFILDSLQFPISFSAFEAEHYQNYLAISPNVGTLVAYYSDDRPVPYLASEWRKEGLDWVFKLREGLACEDGEGIDAHGFVRSLKRSMRILSKNNDQPIFNKLRGYSDFRHGKSDVLGIEAVDAQTLVFRFTEDIKSGLLEFLSMVPFGYLCDANFGPGNVWKDTKKIVSSGPYKLAEYKEGEYCRLDLREEFNTFATPQNTEAPRRVFIRGGTLADVADNQQNLIFESSSREMPHKEGFTMIPQIPQAMYTACLSTDDGKFFSNEQNRLVFAQVFRKHLAATPFESASGGKSEFLYPNQPSSLPSGKTVNGGVKPPAKPLVLRMRPRDSSGVPEFIDEVAIKTLNELGWSYKPVFNPEPTYSDLQNTQKYDIRFVWNEVGGGVEAWILDLLFCSEVGPKFADPSGRICQLARDFNLLPISTVSLQLNTALFEDAALFPMTYKSSYYLMSNNLEVRSLSPMISRIRFEELRLKK